MKHLKTYKNYKESLIIDLEFTDIDLMESLNIWHDEILRSIGAEVVNMFHTFKLPEDHKTDIDFLSNDVYFLNSLASISFKKSSVQNTDDLECYINKPCRFMLIYKVEKNELEDPSFIIFQSWNDTLKKWDDAKLYKIHDKIQRFYDKLTSKIIEISDGDQNYIYSTSNSNEWILQNTDRESETYKKIFRKDEFEKLLSDRRVKIKII